MASPERSLQISSASMDNFSISSRPASPRTIRSPRTHAPGGGVVIQLESLQQTVRDQQATIKELTRQVDDLMKFKTSMNDFLAYKSEIQRMINGVEKKMADQAAADQKQRAWFQTRLDTHKREIAKLLDSDRNKAERLRIIEEQLAGMDFDMYALSGAGGEQRSDFSEHGLGATSPPEVDQKSM